MASNTPGVVNAAVGFDERTLAPTYELRIGVPGASAGINIAQQLGLNPEIVAVRPRAAVATQTQDIARFLDRLHANLRESDTERLASAPANRNSHARKSQSRNRRQERAARQGSRDGEEAGERAAKTSSTRRAKR